MGELRVTCSTPFGIYGRNTRRPSSSVAWFHCAQRLSASTEGTHDRIWIASLSHFMRAQRLSASTEGTLGCGVPALQHPECAQRLSASTEGTRRVLHASGSEAIVLNAFRHLRKEHPSMSSAELAWTKCSTPFGIYGRNTQCQLLGLCHLRRAQRLSASTEGTP